MLYRQKHKYTIMNKIEKHLKYSLSTQDIKRNWLWRKEKLFAERVAPYNLKNWVKLVIYLLELWNFMHNSMFIGDEVIVKMRYQLEHWDFIHNSFFVGVELIIEMRYNRKIVNWQKYCTNNIFFYLGFQAQRSDSLSLSLFSSLNWPLLTTSFCYHFQLDPNIFLHLSWVYLYNFWHFTTSISSKIYFVYFYPLPNHSLLLSS